MPFGWLHDSEQYTKQCLVTDSATRAASMRESEVHEERRGCWKHMEDAWRGRAQLEWKVDGTDNGDNKYHHLIMEG